MPTISEKYKSEGSGGDFLKADDLKGRAVKVRITSVKWVTMPKYNEPDVTVDKVVCSLEGTDKVYVVNIPSGHAIAAAYGDDPETWAGKKIILKPHLYNGKFLGIAGEPDLAVSEGFSEPQPQQPKRAEVPRRADAIGDSLAEEYRHIPPDDELDDDIPF